MSAKRRNLWQLSATPLGLKAPERSLMAVWTYANWATMRDSSQRLTAAGFTALNNHIAEVNAAISASVSSNGNSRDAATLQELLTSLMARHDKELTRSRINAKVHRHSFGTLS